jgi:hypothetical protein
VKRALGVDTTQLIEKKLGSGEIGGFRTHGAGIINLVTTNSESDVTWVVFFGTVG